MGFSKGTKATRKLAYCYQILRGWAGAAWLAGSRHGLRCVILLSGSGEQLSKQKINGLWASGPCARNILSTGYLICWISCLFLLHLYESSLLLWLFICLGISQEITRHNRKLLGFPQLPHTVKYADVLEVAQNLQRSCKGLSSWLVLLSQGAVLLWFAELHSCVIKGALVRLLQGKNVFVWFNSDKERKGGGYHRLKSS